MSRFSLLELPDGLEEEHPFTGSTHVASRANDFSYHSKDFRRVCAQDFYLMGIYLAQALFSLVHGFKVSYDFEEHQHLTLLVAEPPRLPNACN